MLVSLISKELNKSIGRSNAIPCLIGHNTVVLGWQDLSEIPPIYYIHIQFVILSYTNSQFTELVVLFSNTMKIYKHTYIIHLCDWLTFTRGMRYALPFVIQTSVGRSNVVKWGTFPHISRQTNEHLWSTLCAYYYSASFSIILIFSACTWFLICIFNPPFCLYSWKRLSKNFPICLV